MEKVVTTLMYRFVDYLDDYDYMYREASHNVLEDYLND